MCPRMDSLNNGSFVWLEAVCGERNIARRYTVALSRDLFGPVIGNANREASPVDSTVF